MVSRRAGPRTMAARRAQRTRGAQTQVTAEREPFPVVAVGASAGGLEAFRALLAALPTQSGMSFILVQHLDPIHTSMLVELLSPYTGMTILEARDEVRPQPDRIHIIPPGRFLSVADGVLRLSYPRDGQGVRMPFDYLLHSLAAAFGERAVSIVLSGTGNDGSAGARAIKVAGGLVIAQDPEEAEFEGMPRAAITTGSVDLVLPVAKMPEALARYGGHRYVRRTESGTATPLGDALQKIVNLLREETSYDFTLYKAGTLERRIERRMALAGIEDTDQYHELMTHDRAELKNLADDLFINVTRFFRDPMAFDRMADKIVPELVRAQPSDQPLRVWVAACSSGEEAYSIAMLFLEEIAAAQRNLKLQIFASDIDRDAVVFARDGFYPPSIEADVSPARLSRFFTKEDNGFRVARELRAAIVFSIHDVVGDAPFSRLDLISCRNLLIYLRPEVQQRVLSQFHFALHDRGILLLSPAETVGTSSNRFEPISQSQRIYRHIGRGRPGEAGAPPGRREATRSPWLRSARPPVQPRVSVSDLAQRLLLDSYAPASVLTNRKHKGLFYFGPTDLYLKMPPGVADQDILASAREGLRPAIRMAFDRAGHAGEPEATIAGHVMRDGRPVAVIVSARIVKNDEEELILVSFREPAEHELSSRAMPDATADAPKLERTEQELDATRKELEEAIHYREIAEQEIRAINEEAMSVSEEFQTTNEELETSREELQSLNEELTALNSQLQETLSEHQAIANDLENTLNSADVATLFLDENLRIRFFTPAARALFSVISSDVGRPLADLARHFADGNLLADARMVLASLVPMTREIEAENGAWYTCRILPYRTKDNRIEGVVITFVDITTRKQAEEALDAARVQAETANLGKSRFLAAASHDLRQPLQTLSVLQGLLARKLKDSQELQFVVRIEEAVTAMSVMLNSLLNINQLEVGVIHPEFADFPINDLLDRMTTEFAYQMESHGLEWRVIPSRLAVRSDPRLLEQMLRNLLSNAMKYTRKGGVLLGCRRRGDKLRIETWDTGLGIPQEQLPAIFQEFHQIDNPSREPSQGLGLGLAIVQRLGDLLGHTVDVRSRRGSGSVFSIEVAIVPQGKSLSPTIEREPVAIAAPGGRVLIIEDHPALRGSLEALMRADGYRTVAVADGDEAIEYAMGADAWPDIVIVDFNLPRGLTGPEVMARLREIIRHDLPALVLTGDISTETLTEIARQGYVHRTKPMRSDDLTGLIRTLLMGRSPAGPRGASRPPAIFVVDDDATIRESLREFIEAAGRPAEVYGSAREFFDTWTPGWNGCLVVDCQMPDMDGIELVERLRAAGHQLPAIMITGYGDLPLAIRAMKAGASSFIEKPIHADELLAAIDHAQGQALGYNARAALSDATAALIAALTPRERQVMDLLMEGKANKQMAYVLGISQRTVENHRAAVMKKFGAKSLSQLVRLTLDAALPVVARTLR
jgi:two-component system, chemotaxis family, CheB/CheR fusion protein